MLESGRFASITEPVADEKCDRCYLCCVLRSTMLAPGVFEAILDARQGPEVILARVL